MKDCTAARGEKTLYLIRHACVDDPDGERICLGQKLDSPLGEKGRMQAQALARALSSVRLDAVYTSPLLRARQTAQALTDAPIVLDELTELDGGEWDGLPFSEIRARYPGFFADRAKRPSPPGGETDEAGAARGLRALQIIADGPGKTLAAVAHASLNRLILSAVLDRPYCTKKAIPQPNACVSVLVYDGQWRAEQVGLSAEEWARENA